MYIQSSLSVTVLLPLLLVVQLIHADRLTEEKSGSETAGTVFAAMALVALIILGHWFLRRVRNEYSNSDNTTYNAPVPSASWTPVPVFSLVEVSAVRTATEKREQRIARIMDSIIRKVCMPLRILPNL